MDMSESPFFFPCGNRRLFGIFHAPRTALRGAFVFCHAFAEEKLWAHRVHVSFARELAARGYAVLRFDHFGHGDSEGAYQDATLERYREDIGAALAALDTCVANDCPVGLLGLRLGASLAALAAEEHPHLQRLVLWDPILDGEKYGQEILLSNLATQMATHGKVVADRSQLVAQMEAGQTVNVDGYEVAHALFSQLSALRLTGSRKRFSGQTLIVQIDRGPKPPRADLERLQSEYANATLVQVVEQPFWKETKEFYARAERLSAATLEWLLQT